MNTSKYIFYTIKIICFIFILISFSTTAQTSEGIVSDYYNAIGGKSRIDSVKTALIKLDGINPFTSSSNITSLKRDFKYRSESFYEDGKVTIFCSNGLKCTGSNKAAITMAATMGRKPKTFSLFNDLIFVTESELLREPDEEINGKLCEVLSYNDVEWDTYHKYYFNAENHLLVYEEVRGISSSLTTLISFQEYRQTGGILFPMRNARIMNGDEYIEEYTEIILNPELPDDIFVYEPK